MFTVLTESSFMSHFAFSLDRISRDDIHDFIHFPYNNND